uniref:Uncharacterized protein n=1 Tax=Arundo donax TaxID=35708 RepID=A0A0A9BEG3_ARUDO
MFAYHTLVLKLIDAFPVGSSFVIAQERNIGI